MDDLRAAADTVAVAGLQPSVRLALQRDVLDRALELLTQGDLDPGPSASLGPTGFNELDLRAALEATYRSLAELARDPAEHCSLVDRANSIRPRSLT